MSSPFDILRKAGLTPPPEPKRTRVDDPMLLTPPPVINATAQAATTVFSQPSENSTSLKSALRRSSVLPQVEKDKLFRECTAEIEREPSLLTEGIEEYLALAERCPQVPFTHQAIEVFRAAFLECITPEEIPNKKRQFHKFLELVSRGQATPVCGSSKGLEAIGKLLSRLYIDKGEKIYAQDYVVNVLLEHYPPEVHSKYASFHFQNLLAHRLQTTPTLPDLLAYVHTNLPQTFVSLDKLLKMLLQEDLHVITSPSQLEKLADYLLRFTSNSLSFPLLTTQEIHFYSCWVESLFALVSKRTRVGVGVLIQLSERANFDALWPILQPFVTRQHLDDANLFRLLAKIAHNHPTLIPAPNFLDGPAFQYLDVTALFVLATYLPTREAFIAALSKPNRFKADRFFIDNTAPNACRLINQALTNNFSENEYAFYTFNDGLGLLRVLIEKDYFTWTKVLSGLNIMRFFPNLGSVKAALALTTQYLLKVDPQEDSSWQEKFVQEMGTWHYVTLEILQMFATLANVKNLPAFISCEIKLEIKPGDSKIALLRAYWTLYTQGHSHLLKKISHQNLENLIWDLEKNCFHRFAAEDRPFLIEMVQTLDLFADRNVVVPNGAVQENPSIPRNLLCNPKIEMKDLVFASPFDKLP